MQTKNYSAYLKQIEHFLSGDDFKNALKHARPLIKKLPYLSLSPKKKYEVFLLLGKLYSMAGNYMASLEYFYKIRSLALKYRWSSRYLIQADYYVGIVYLDLYNPLRAIKQFNKACAYYEKYGFDGNLTKKLYIMTQVCLIQSYLKQNDVARIENIIKHNMKPCQEELLKEDYSTTLYYHALGEYYIHIKKYTEARRILEKAQAVNKKNDYFYMLVADKLHLAMIELMDNHWDKSVDYLKTMLTECHRFQYNDLYAEGALLLSKVYSLQGKYQLSKRTQDKVKNVIKKLDTVWLYEKIREFDRLYQRLVDLRIISKSKVSSEVPAVLKTQLAAHKDTHSYRRIIIGQSEPMYRVYNLLNKIAPTDLPVLIEGETGTGKELIARAIHGKSQRTGRNFFAFNCGAIPETLLENELFGHVPGAFTGAREEKKGLIKLADQSTLFFDEIANMPLKMQQKLLRVLEEKKIWPLGSEKDVGINTRFIFASNKRIEKLVEQKSFRHDFFYRINTIVVALPALRERKDDIPLLAHYFLRKYATENEQARIDQEAMTYLVNYAWPGNVRELENEIQKICTLYPDKEHIAASMISLSIRNAPATSINSSALKELTGSYQKDIIIRTFQECDHNISQTARKLRCSRRHLYTKMKQLKIDLADLKNKNNRVGR